MSKLSDLLALLRQDLKDGDSAVWTDAELTQQVHRALREVSACKPRLVDATIKTAAGEYEVALSALEGLMEVVDVWYPWDPAEPRYPPLRPRGWSVVSDDTLLLDTDTRPTGATGCHLRVFYTAPQTLQGLDGATSTTLDGEGEELVVLGAGAYAAAQRGLDSIGRVMPSGWTQRELAAWAEARLEAFGQRLERVRRRRVLAGDPRVAWVDRLARERGGV